MSEIYVHHPAFLRLFRVELDALLQGRNNLIPKIRELIPAEDKADFQKALEEAKNISDVSYICTVGLRGIPIYEKTFWKWYQEQLLGYVANIRDKELYDMLTSYPKNWDPDQADKKHHFEHFFANDQLLDIIVDLLNLKDLIKVYREKNIEAYENIMNLVEHRMTDPATSHNYYYAAAEFLRRLFYCNPGVVCQKQRCWYTDFLHALSMDPKNTVLVDMLDPDYAMKIAVYIAKLELLEEQIIAETQADYFRENEGIDGEFIHQPFEADSIFKEEEEEDMNMPLVLRNYQVELARHAREGLNAVICAPTGSGKTIVAIDIILKHLEMQMNPITMMPMKARVVFIVPTVPLVDQQRKQICHYLPARYVVQGFHGTDKEEAGDRTQKIINSHVVVCTPQLLVNMLKSIKRKERIYIEYFTLMVFDECHHCDKEHPYHNLMKEIRAVHDRRGKAYCPQIVGLTASLGVGKDTQYSTEGASKNILRLCARMMADQLSSVQSETCKESLKAHVNPPLDMFIKVERPAIDQFRESLFGPIQEIMDLITPNVQTAMTYIERLKDFKIPTATDVDLSTGVQRIIESFPDWKDKESKLFTVNGINHLKVYIHALHMNDLLPAIFAFSYIVDEKFGKIRDLNDEGPFHQIFKEHREALDAASRKDTGGQKDIIVRLLELLNAEYTSNPSTRALIFVETRQSAIYLAQMLQRSQMMRAVGFDDQSVRALTSSNQSSKLGGTSNADQKRILQGFANGTVKLLVVTSLAEEGLDIQACNLIIKYNTVGSERTRTQRHGRARQQSSKAVLLALADAVEQREIRNITLEHLMQQCLQNLQAQSDAQLKKLIAATDEEVRKAEETKAAEAQNAAAFRIDNEFDINCLGCQTRICSTRDIRHLHPYYVCVENTIWKNVRVGRSDKPASNDVITSCGTMCCIRCKRPIGSVIRYLDLSFLPAINGKAIRIKKRAGNSNPADDDLAKNWTDIAQRCVIHNVSQNDLIRMAMSLSRYGNEGDYETMMEEARLAVRLKCEAIRRKRLRKVQNTLEEYDGHNAYQ